MDKLIWTPEERKAIEDSINHWQTDIINRFLKGDSVRKGLQQWNDSTEVKDFSEHCALCHLYLRHNAVTKCSVCPYNIYYGHSCDSSGSHWSHWALWCKTRCLETATAMRDALKLLLEVG